mmetsp:Transcript_1978/g.2811  ORF Transcript_1978/g.2811 Transcript_1978/m.2811 type:complete len:382 (+) Transcript_1978:8-1153(+)
MAYRLARLVRGMAANGAAPRFLYGLSKINFKSRSFYNRGRCGIGAAILAITAAHTSHADGAGRITLPMLKKQDSTLSNAIIDMYANNPRFIEVSEKATKAILKRDAEDAEKLQKGIDLAISKGVIPKNIVVESVYKVRVTGKTADEVANEIIAGMGDEAKKGCVMTLQGLSGTGKGTTVSKLKEKLPNAATWSNGNIFRSLTLLAATYSEMNNCSLEEALTPELISKYTKMLHFGKFNGKFDVRINGLGHDLLVSEVRNTVLKGPQVGKNIPTVASVTQGEVINFVQKALKDMTKDGVTVLLEGREQTLNYIRTPHRYELVLADTNVIGMRRAAQRMGAEALQDIESNFIFKLLRVSEKIKPSQISNRLHKALMKMYNEKD